METKSGRDKFKKLRRRIKCEGYFTVNSIGKGGGLMLLCDGRVNVEIENYSERQWV